MPDIVPPLLLPPTVALEPSPPTVKLPVAAEELFHIIPLLPPDAEIDLNVKLPSESTKLTAVEEPVDILTPFTVSPAAPLADKVPVSVGVFAVLPPIVSGPTERLAPAPIND